jgi:sec-independent protein translocase protein TatA
MGTFSIWHWIIVLAVVLLLFGGRGKISQIMGDFGKGLKSFKKSIREEDEPFEDSDTLSRAPMALPNARARARDAVNEGDRAARL